MPQGITGAPATFQRLMEKAVGDMNLLQVLVYLDDLIILGKTLEEHEEGLLKVLDRLGESLKKAQEGDEAIGPAIQAVKHGQWPDDASKNPELLRLKREIGKLSMKDGLLHRYTKKPSGEMVSQLVLPSEFRPIVMQAMHDDLEHLGQERTIDLLRSRFFWPKMSMDVEVYIRNCGECVAHKTPPQKAAPLHQIISHGPMDLVCMDFLSMEPDSKGIANVLVVTDHFTRYAQAFPTKSQKAQVVAKTLR
ncbi:hypothetical protein MHYP_G00216310 [Metynnis hypsauchen]